MNTKPNHQASKRAQSDTLLGRSSSMDSCRGRGNECYRITSAREIHSPRWRAVTTWTTMALVAIVMLDDVNAFATTSNVNRRLLPRRTITTRRSTRQSGSLPTEASTFALSVMASPSNTDSPAPQRCTDIEFELHVGKAMDTLKKDYVDLLVDDPNYSIYAQDMDFVDPRGISVHGLHAYQNAFRLLHALIKFLYCPAKSAMTSFRMFYDPTKRSIRIHWNAEIVPREIFGGDRSIKYVDGISVYELSRFSGEIVAHRLEQLIMNNQAILPQEGVVAALSEVHGNTVPSFYQPSKMEHQDLFNVPFLSWNSNKHLQESLFSSASTAVDANTVACGNSLPKNRKDASSSSSSLHSFEASRSGGGGGANDEPLEVNREALEQKNKSRKKFGMPPFTPEEFVSFESTVKQMDAEQQVKRQQQQQIKQAAAAAQAEQAKRKSNNPFNKLFGGVLKDTCENNFDCERPEICCDFGFKKMCCSSGSLVLGQPKMATVPVPIGCRDGDPDDPYNGPDVPRRY